MTRLTMQTADGIADRTIEAGKASGAEPLTVAVLDAGGHVVVMKRSDGSGILRCDIAYGKAWGALGMGVPTRKLAERGPAGQSFFTAVAAASQGRLIPVPGGVLLRDADGSIVGAVGVSGDVSDVDEECALKGIEGSGFRGDIGAG